MTFGAFNPKVGEEVKSASADNVREWQVLGPCVCRKAS